MTMLSFKQVKSNYGKKEPCEQGCSWINFGYRKYDIIFQFELKMAVHAARTKKKICEVNNF